MATLLVTSDVMKASAHAKLTPEQQPHYEPPTPFRSPSSRQIKWGFIFAIWLAVKNAMDRSHGNHFWFMPLSMVFLLVLAITYHRTELRRFRRLDLPNSFIDSIRIAGCYWITAVMVGAGALTYLDWSRPPAASPKSSANESVRY